MELSLKAGLDKFLENDVLLEWMQRKKGIFKEDYIFGEERNDLSENKTNGDTNKENDNENDKVED